MPSTQSTLGLSYIPRRHILTAGLLLLLLWPLLDVSCPLTPLLPLFLQRQLVEFHVQPVALHEKSISAGVENLTAVTTLHGHYSEQEVLKLVKDNPYSSVLIKSFLTKDVAEDLMYKFKSITANKNYSLLNDSANVDDRLGGIFSSGLHVNGDPWADFNSGRRRLVQSDLSGILNGSAKDVYGAFVPIGERSMQNLVNWTSRKFAPVAPSFFGFFTKRFVTTPIHGHWPADTLTLQLAGRKQYILIDPFDMKATLSEQRISLHSAGAGGVYYPNLKVDKKLTGRLQIVNAEPGDLLYFPTYTAHTVVSDPGLNVMTALQLMTLKAFKIHPWKTLQAGIYFAVDNTYKRIRAYLGTNKYAQKYDISKKSLISTGVPLKSFSPAYDDLQMKKILEKVAPFS